jgi:DNA invertase Pin-like site-specific DNA recombinase
MQCNIFRDCRTLQRFDESVASAIVVVRNDSYKRCRRQGKLIASLMAALAEFERDLLRERVRSGISAARKRGVVFGRRPGQRIKADRFAPKDLKLVGEASPIEKSATGWA